MFPTQKAVRIGEAILDQHLRFYLDAEMITEDEHKACLRGDMSITDAKTLFNINVRHPTLKTGERATLYKGRAIDIIADLLLGVEPRERGGKR